MCLSYCVYCIVRGCKMFSFFNKKQSKSNKLIFYLLKIAVNMKNDQVPISATHHFINEIRMKKVVGSYRIAHATVTFVRRLIATRKWNNVDGLIAMLQAECRLLSECLPNQLIVPNMIKRILKMIRDEVLRQPNTVEREQHLNESLQKLWIGDTGDQELATSREWKTSIVENVGELLAELETCGDNIAAQAEQHVRAGDTVVTIGWSKTVEAFLRAAACRQRFRLLVVECAPRNTGRLLVEAMKNCKNIHCRLIADAAAFSTMPQASKVIIGTEQVLANGSLRAIAGTYSLCLSAHHFRVPVIVCSPFYKLTPLFLSEDDQERFNELRSPMELVPFSNAITIGRLQIYNPAYDLVPPDLITLLITNVSGNAPSYIYRLINELYHAKDTSFAAAGLS
ncbi:Translation initiation factor eIF-2B subunit beta [Trichinella pseudospiralis]|uniref:Translation initiation factor eIF2B subunit beta n=1 Tax=Trichinella pseudospiralis TaxID=6337 RepID=A0A0V1IYQ2_TRIPS|nr:Translation initiation factor eIF-2B subunit beta [Trichinella pseudospiralis]